MQTMLLLIRILLAAVFAVAGVAKLADLPGSRKAVEDFGVPVGAAGAIGALLPLAELTAAVALLFAATAWAGALGATALLLGFCAGIGNVIRRGEEVDCHCFGQLQSSTAGPKTLARNLGLAAGAAFVVAAGAGDAGPGAFGWLGELDTAEAIALATAVLGLAAVASGARFGLGLLRQNGRLLLRVEALEAALRTGEPLAGPVDPNAAGLPVGAPAPVYAEGLLEPGRPLLVLFTDENCGPCREMAPTVERWRTEHASRLTIETIEGDREVFAAFEVVPTPSAVLVAADGRIASAVESGEQNITGLLDRALARPTVVQVAAAAPGASPAPMAPAAPAAPAMGSRAPEIELPDLDGNPVELASFRGRDAVVMFWNPGCGFCRDMLADLREWEADPPSGAPQPVLISSGGADANREMGLRSPIVLDEAMAAMHAFGATGTPMAVRIDARGRVASELAVGAPAVWSQLRNGG
jgi:thiol-disulfide isomerase/thioredoxin/uncharacterized membrane protein YphA (DoxX/SURF4 family)